MKREVGVSTLFVVEHPFVASHVRSKGLAAALYSGRKEVEDIIWASFDYVKVGPYIEAFGPLNSRTTNQRLYHILPDGTREDITFRFWHRGIDPNA